MVEFVWVDYNRCYLIATREFLEEGLDFLRQRWLQVNGDVNSEAYVLVL